MADALPAYAPPTIRRTIYPPWECCGRSWTFGGAHGGDLLRTARCKVCKRASTPTWPLGGVVVDYLGNPYLLPWEDCANLARISLRRSKHDKIQPMESTNALDR